MGRQTAEGRVMISVLLPTRGRAKMTESSLAHLLGYRMEVLLWVDDDDPQLEEYGNIMRKLGLKMYVKPRVGYPSMHEMVNFLASKAEGDWLLLWNDDALMHTPDWIGKLPTITHDYPQVLNIYNSNPEVNLFPLINRTMYEAMGHFSMSAHCDSWVQDIANQLDIHTFVPGIEVEHLRDKINDETKQHSQGAYATTSPLHSSARMIELLEEDIKKVKRALS
jgi:hypothetical protein